MQKYETSNEYGSGSVLSFASILEKEALDQANRLSRLPIIHEPVVLMPDAHFGFGPPVGAVVKTEGAVIPYAVGTDIGCGMEAVRLEMHRSELVGVEGKILGGIRRNVPSGVGRNHDIPPIGWFEFLRKTEDRAPALSLDDASLAGQQFGTLGAGNHFIELSEDESGFVWIVLHSGSRGIGNKIANHYVRLAKEDCEQRGVKLEDKNFAYFLKDNPLHDEYLNAMTWAQDYARAQRHEMLSGVFDAVLKATGRNHIDVTERISCHHNYAEVEGDTVLTRKGAIAAQVGMGGVIPGSMASNTFIVRGLGCEVSYHSAPHGAGRQVARRKARETLDLDEFKQQMAGKTWQDRDAKRLLDEAPNAYKPVEQVIADSAKLIAVEHTLSQFINYKGL